ncbi:MAG: hypothetical protein IOD12_13905 [Silvanigrellales bacterium]|nr:hypothetical protein [Silvanigrellales bacterium]
MTQMTQYILASLAMLGLSACGTGPAFVEVTTKDSAPKKTPLRREPGVASEFDYGSKARASDDQSGLLVHRMSDIRGGADVIAACDAGTKQTLTAKLNFPSTRDVIGEVCSNAFPGTDDVIRGIRKQVATVALPKNAVVCGGSFDAQSGVGASAPWSFDDEVIFTLNDVLVATSQHEYLWMKAASREEPIMPEFGSGFLFDWNTLTSLKLFNTQGNEDSQYCYGVGPATRCLLPVTQKPGVLELTLNPEAFSEIAFKALQEGELTSALWVTGDNDPAIDCRHSGIEIEATLEYVQLSEL